MQTLTKFVSFVEAQFARAFLTFVLLQISLQLNVGLLLRCSIRPSSTAFYIGLMGGQRSHTNDTFKLKGNLQYNAQQGAGGGGGMVEEGRKGWGGEVVVGSSEGRRGVTWGGGEVVEGMGGEEREG